MYVYVRIYVHTDIYFSGSIPSYRHTGTFKTDSDYKSIQSKMALMKSCKSFYHYYNTVECMHCNIRNIHNCNKYPVNLLNLLNAVFFENEM